MSRREEILSKIDGIEGIPTAATKLIELLQDPDASIVDILAVLEYDPGLTSGVLRIANSAHFAGKMPIGSLRDAVVRLGTKRIFQLVMTSAIAPIATRPIKGYDLSRGKLLEQAVAAALGAEELAKATNTAGADIAFTAGLLHGIGKIVMGTFLELDAEPILKLAFENQMPFDEAEREVLGIDHAEVGATLLSSWELPQDIVDVVRWHLNPDAFPGEDTSVVDLVHVAVLMSLETGIGTGIDGLNYRPSRTVVERMKLKTLDKELAMCGMLSSLESLRDVLLPREGEQD